MLVIYSHVLAFSVLFIAAIWDLKTTEAPDFLAITGVSGGLMLHTLYSYFGGYMNIGLLTSSISKETIPSLIYSLPYAFQQLGFTGWIQVLGEPLAYSLGIGLIFSIYGWSLYFTGMWGGADAFAMSVLGFAAPFGISGIGLGHAVSLFINIMVVGFIYTLVFAFYNATGAEGILENLIDRFKDNERMISLQILLVAVLSFIFGFLGSVNAYIFFLALVSMIIMYHILKVVENNAFSSTVPVEELEGGEVAAPNQGLGKKVRGITEEEIADLEMEELEIRSGVKFIPVFPISLLITSAGYGGIDILNYLVIML